MRTRRGRFATVALVIGLLVVVLGAAAAEAGETDTTGTGSTESTTTVSGGTSTETVVKIETEKNTDDIVRWGGLAVVVIIAIALVWYFVLRDRSDATETTEE